MNTIERNITFRLTYQSFVSFSNSKYIELFNLKVLFVYLSLFLYVMSSLNENDRDEVNEEKKIKKISERHALSSQIRMRPLRLLGARIFSITFIYIRH